MDQTGVFFYLNTKILALFLYENRQKAFSFKGKAP